MRLLGWMVRHRGVCVLLACMLVLALWPHAVYADKCGVTDPKPCFDDLSYQTVVQVQRAIWFIDRPLLLIARWLEALRTYLVDGVLATAFDATIAGMRKPFWLVAALAWLVFVVGYFASIIVDLRWVNLRRGVQFCVLAVVLFQWGSPALAATENLRATVGQGFAKLAATSVDDTSLKLSFFSANDHSMQDPHSIYKGEADCSGASTARSDKDAIYLNDLTANYLWATAEDIHCPDTTSGSSALPKMFEKGAYYSFFGYSYQTAIDEDEEPARKNMIRLAQDGVMRLILGFFMALGAIVEQLLNLLFTLCLAMTWISVLINLLFALFVPTENMFTRQITAGITILKTSWLASLWVGIMLAVVMQAAKTGNGMATFGATLLMILMLVWQIKIAIELFMDTVAQTNTTFGNAPSAIGGMAKGLAFGGVGGAVAGGLAALGRKKGFDEAGGKETGESSGAAAYGIGATLQRFRPLRRAGQLAQATGLASNQSAFVQGLTGPRAADPLAWANVQRDGVSGRDEARRVLQRQRSERADSTPSQSSAAPPRAPSGATVAILPTSQRSRPDTALPSDQQSAPAAPIEQPTPATTRVDPETIRILHEAIGISTIPLGSDGHPGADRGTGPMPNDASNWFSGPMDPAKLRAAREALGDTPIPRWERGRVPMPPLGMRHSDARTAPLRPPGRSEHDSDTTSGALTSPQGQSDPSVPGDATDQDTPTPIQRRIRPASYRAAPIRQRSERVRARDLATEARTATLPQAATTTQATAAAADTTQTAPSAALSQASATTAAAVASAGAPAPVGTRAADTPAAGASTRTSIPTGPPAADAPPTATGAPASPGAPAAGSTQVPTTTVLVTPTEDRRKAKVGAPTFDPAQRPMASATGATGDAASAAPAASVASSNAASTSRTSSAPVVARDVDPRTLAAPVPAPAAASVSATQDVPATPTAPSLPVAPAPAPPTPQQAAPAPVVVPDGVPAPATPVVQSVPVAQPAASGPRSSAAAVLPRPVAPMDAGQGGAAAMSQQAAPEVSVIAAPVARSQNAMPSARATPTVAPVSVPPAAVPQAVVPVGEAAADAADPQRAQRPRARRVTPPSSTASSSPASATIPRRTKN